MSSTKDIIGMPSSHTYDYAVIIPHYNDVTRLVRCLDALKSQDRTLVEIIVADNASTVSLDDVRRQFDWVRFVTEPNKGAGAARNGGVAATTAPWLFFLDSDCVPDPDWLAQAKACAQDENQAICGGFVGVFHETPPPQSGAEIFEAVFAFDQETYVLKKGFSVTANLIIPRDTFESVGPFKVGVSEDFEWCLRATAAGFRLRYAPALRVMHATRPDWTSLHKKWRRLTDEEFGLKVTTSKARLKWALKACAMPFSIFAHAPKILAYKDASISEKARGVLTLIRLRLLRMVWMLGQALQA